MFIFSIIYTLLMSFTMIGFGALFLKYPPKEINGIFGYRTTMSTKNQETWNFAHQYSGKVWVISGIINLVVFTLILLIFKDSSSFENILIKIVFAQLVVLLFVILPTEIALRKRFDKDGNCK